jgi:FixJ family two-component response regulator
VTTESSRVFVIDDDADVRSALTRLIGTAGYVVEAFASARAFLARPPMMDPPASFWICACPRWAASSCRRPSSVPA